MYLLCNIIWLYERIGTDEYQFYNCILIVVLFECRIFRNFKIGEYFTGITPLGIIGGYHIVGHGLPEAAGTGYTTIAVSPIYLVIKNLNRHRFIYIEIIVNIFCKVFFQDLHIFPCAFSPNCKYSMTMEKAVVYGL